MGVEALTVKRWISLAGGVLVAVSLLFIGQRLWAELAKAQALAVGADLWATAAIGSLIYGFASVFLILAWHRLIHLFAGIRVPFRATASLYARSQIGKYIPGNIAHIAGRHVMGRALGVSHRALAVSALAEIFGLVVTASSVGLLALLAADIGQQRTHILAWVSVGAMASGFLFVSFMPSAWSRLRSRWEILPVVGAAALRRESAAVALLYLCYFLFAGLVLVLLVAIRVDDMRPYDAVALTGVFAVAWLAGYVTPGAPSGIGIREALIVLALDHLHMGGESLLIAVLLRVVTLCGDALLFLMFLRAAPLDAHADSSPD